MIQLIAAVAVFLALFVALMPEIAGIGAHHHTNRGASGAGAVLWPMCFMLGFVSDFFGFKPKFAGDFFKNFACNWKLWITLEDLKWI